MLQSDITPSREDETHRFSLSQALNPTCLQSPAWYQAMTLTERVAALHEVQSRAPNGEVSTALAERRMQRWQAQPPFTTSSYFAQRLTVNEITEDEFCSLLAEPIEAVHDRCPTPPAWLMELARAFSRPTSFSSRLLPKAPRGQEVAGLLTAIEPLISQGYDRVREGAQALSRTQSNLPFDPSIIEDVLFANLPGQLLMMLSRTMVLELHVARLQGLLKGNTPEERFQSFMRRLRQHDRVLAILQEYPVLARQLVTAIDHWVTSSLEFLTHLCADWDAIRTTFSPDKDPGVLVELEGTGDKHRAGRSVLIARFSSGFQVVYKPKPLAVDAHFQELLTWSNDRSDHLTFRTLKILDRGTYGWVEFVLAQSCTSAEEIWCFYERQGGYLALLYALEATDFHFENLIAAGKQPVLLDLEALFHPRVGGIDVKQADQLAGSTINYSVLRVGLLPQRIWSNAESEGVDLSGLGATAGQLTPSMG